MIRKKLKTINMCTYKKLKTKYWEKIFNIYKEYYKNIKQIYVY